MQTKCFYILGRRRFTAMSCGTASIKTQLNSKDAKYENFSAPQVFKQSFHI